MCAARRRTTVYVTWCVFLLLIAGGCNRRQTEQEAIDQYYKNNPGEQARVPVAKVAGRVSIDGQPPAANLRLFVVLSNPERPDKPGEAPRLFALCDDQGNFAFTTYFTGDGVPCGKYVADFVELHRQKAPPRARSSRPERIFIEPDELKNLYNDPEKNKNDQTLVLDVQSPGRTDYEFDLWVAGKDPVAKPGPHAVTWIKL
jgi:hypothetical protein